MKGSNSYSPNPVTVQVGQQIRWRNDDTIPHTATGGGFDTGLLGPGMTSTAIKLSVPGVVNYFCQPHPSMVGTLNVTP